MRETCRFRFAAAVAAIGTLACTSEASRAQTRMPRLAERVGLFRSPALDESSGVAVSRHYPGVLWTLNDSGNSATIYAINLQGDELARFRVRGADNRDWEDLALAPCPGAPADCLYIADTGDNTERNKAAHIYIVLEPNPTGANGTDRRRSEPAHDLKLTYPDRPHDVEAIWIDDNGDLSLVTKGPRAPIAVYGVPRGALMQDTATARLLQELPIIPQKAFGRLVTGADRSPDGSTIVIRTYTELYYFRRDANHRLVPQGPACWLGTLEPQGEGVAFLDDSTLVLTSESPRGLAGPIHRVRC